MNTQIATNKRLLPQARRKAIRPRPLSVIIGLAVVGLSSAVNAATSFPDYPLQTHAGSVPPNIMFILDNSGSMSDFAMPDGIHYGGQFTHPTTGQVLSAWRDDEKVYLSGVNTLAYDPMKVYRPWRNADGSRWPDMTPNAVYYNLHAATASDRAWQVNLRAQGLSGGHLKKSSKYTTMFLILREPGLNPNRYGNYYMYRYDFARNTWTRRSWTGGGNDGRWDSRFYLADNLFGEGQAGFPQVWGNPVDVATPLGVGDAVPTHGVDQLTNYLNWYAYHRMRMGVAKAGASEAFYQLGEQYRVGFDRIDNGQPGELAYTGSVAVPIPVTNDGGLFRSNNKAAWFNFLFSVPATSWTPLRQALYRTGNYYRTDNRVWTASGSGDGYSCRRSYAILTTDGYWNGTDGTNYFHPSHLVGNADGTTTANYIAAPPYMDSQSNTLADIAMHFWKTDLRPEMANDISPTPSNPATWQHMVTFGVSMGLAGTMSPGPQTLNELRNGTLQWSDPIANGAGQRIDDLWHATVNSRGSFVVASDTEEFAKALTDALDAITAENGSGGGIGATGRVIVSGSQVYQGSYQSGTWLGDVKAFALGADGTASGAALWSFAQNSKIPAMNFAGRKVYTSKDGGATGNGTAGEFVSSFMPGTVLAQLARTGGAAPVSAADNIDYIKGVQSKEKAQGGLLRDRATLVGDIVNSVPTYLAANNSIYVGANDGMLHGISAADGKPLFSYMPKGINYAALADISNPNYSHRFFVDGEITISDTTTGSGKNILVSALGRGGKGLFALNVTTPASFSAGNVLWDRTGEGDGDIGYILGKPMILRSNAGNTVVLAPNGIESSNGRASVLVYVLDASGKPTAGSPLKLGQTAGAGNGMMSLAAADIDQNGTVDYVYGGDIQGNVWKIDMTATATSSWKVAHLSGGAAAPMFSARDAANQPQPITGGLSVAREPGTGRLFVSFGTGKFMTDSDKVSATGSMPQTQTLYGIIDEAGTTPVARGDLTARTFPSSGVYAGRTARSLEEYSDLPSSSKGWYLDLGIPASMRGERIVTAPEVVGRLLAVATLVPRAATGCTPETEGNLIAMDAFTGTLPKLDGATSGYFDLDGDGVADKVGNEHIGSISTGIGTGGVNIFIKPDGTLGVLMGTYSGGQARFNILGGLGGSERLNWRELVANE